MRQSGLNPASLTEAKECRNAGFSATMQNRAIRGTCCANRRAYGQCNKGRHDSGRRRYIRVRELRCRQLRGVVLQLGPISF